MEPEINKPGTRGVSHIFAAFGYSMQGLKAALRYEEAFRLELIAAVFLLPLAIWLGRSASEMALLIGSLFIVLLVELINSAIEAVVDRVGTDHHELSGRAKDLGSAAVFISQMNVIVIWGLFIYERFYP
ncbi:MAG: diacylglycerol kinase [Gammaproteobacteria bacterium]|nr:diacylglycerol kinase [Gammaproteobacteria bacterium]